MSRAHVTRLMLHCGLDTEGLLVPHTALHKTGRGKACTGAGKPSTAGRGQDEFCVLMQRAWKNHLVPWLTGDFLWPSTHVCIIDFEAFVSSH